MDYKVTAVKNGYNENIKAAKKRKAEMPRPAPPQPEPIKDSEHLPQPPKSASQSTQTARMIKCAAPTLKTREIARKRHCRRLGANGFAMLEDAAATLAAINAPQNLAANSPPIGRPQLTPYW